MSTQSLPRGCSIVNVNGRIVAMCACDWSFAASGRDAARLAAIDHARRDAWCYVHRDLTPVGADPTMVEPSPRSASRPSKPVKSS